MSLDPLSLLNSGSIFFLDLSEDSFIQVSRDFFDDVRVTFVVGGDYVKKEVYKYKEFNNDILNSFMRDLEI
jgi:hypothetical protein